MEREEKGLEGLAGNVKHIMFSQERTRGLIQHVLTVPVFWIGRGGCLAPKLRPGASKRVPGPAFASWEMRTNLQKRDAQRKFLRHKGAQTLDGLASFAA